MKWPVIEIELENGEKSLVIYTRISTSTVEIREFLNDAEKSEFERNKVTKTMYAVIPNGMTFAAEEYLTKEEMVIAYELKRKQYENGDIITFKRRRVEK